MGIGKVLVGDVSPDEEGVVHPLCVRVTAGMHDGAAAIPRS